MSGLFYDQIFHGDRINPLPDLQVTRLTNDQIVLLPDLSVTELTHDQIL